MRVLLVEDDMDMSDLMKLMLQELAGWEVVHFPSGAEVLEDLDQLAGVDCALVDLKMEPVNGPTLLRRLAELGRAPFPAIYLTGQPPCEEDLTLVRGWIMKPFTYDELMAQLRNLLGDQLTL